MLPEKYCIKACSELEYYGRNDHTNVNGNVNSDNNGEYYYWYNGLGNNHIKEDWNYIQSKKIPENRVLISFETFIKYHNKKDIIYEIY